MTSGGAVRRDMLHLSFGGRGTDVGQFGCHSQPGALAAACG